MSYISLIDQIPTKDKENMQRYIGLYGASAIPTLSVDEWLKFWDHSKQKLYKALGNTLIKEFPITLYKSYEILNNDIFELKEDFYYAYRNLFLYFVKNNEHINEDRYYAANYLPLESLIAKKNNLLTNTYDGNNIKFPMSNGKILQIQKGTKITKAISKLFEAAKATVDVTKEENRDFPEFCKVFQKSFEKFKKDYSIILNEKEIKTTLCFSIHPFDFITMSDNSLRWESCMNWKEPGCYRAGTVEMMNSNNVICAYFKSDSPFEFDLDDKKYSWNNKKWRQLFYVTKDIIVCGKSYPFMLDMEAQIKILTQLKELVCENLGWSYEFGPEHYKDMVHIHSKYRMDKNRGWIFSGNTTKHNILFDTKIMYNDFLNDTKFHYMCYRNKVKSNKIISVSGKGNCICCNQSFLQPVDYNSRDYNDQYFHTHEIICEDCFEKVPTCDLCGCQSPFRKYYATKSKQSGTIKYICSTCVGESIRVCPYCGENFFISSTYPNENLDHLNIYYKFKGEDYLTKMTRCKDVDFPKWYREGSVFEDETNILVKICCCVHCLEKLANRANKNKIWKYVFIIPYRWNNSITERKKMIAEQQVVKKKVLIDNKIKEKTRYESLKIPEFAEDEPLLVQQHFREAKNYFQDFRN